MVRTAGVASAAAALALGVAGNAFDCAIGDFSLSPSVSCDQQSGQGVITVHDTDGTRPVTLTVQTDDSKQVAQQVYKDQGDFTISVPWTAGTHYNVLATVPDHFTNQPVKDGVTLPNTACAAASSSPTASASPSDTPTAAQTVTPTPAASTSAAAVADTSSPSPSGSTSLAETGGGSDSTMIAGIAAALVVVGGGGVFMLRRRTPATRH
jgi:LPXTG-motif cell wall-anchored protein